MWLLLAGSLDTLVNQSVSYWSTRRASVFIEFFAIAASIIETRFEFFEFSTLLEFMACATCWMIQSSAQFAELHKLRSTGIRKIGALPAKGAVDRCKFARDELGFEVQMLAVSLGIYHAYPVVSQVILQCSHVQFLRR